MHGMFRKKKRYVKYSLFFGKHDSDKKTVQTIALIQTRACVHEVVERFLESCMQHDHLSCFSWKHMFLFLYCQSDLSLCYVFVSCSKMQHRHSLVQIFAHIPYLNRYSSIYFGVQILVLQKNMYT